MTIVYGLLKPCYVFAPDVLLRRIRLAFEPRSAQRRDVAVPWGASLNVNVQEGIGRELYRQKIFDIAVSEAAWRLLDPGDKVVDVGANIGYMTTLFATRVGPTGRVEAFEPHPRIFGDLERNVGAFAARSDIAPIRLHACAVGDSDGTGQLAEPDGFARNEGGATFLRVGANTARCIDVPLARLDTVLSGARVALLKIDVEGYESAVLAGASRLLSARRIESVIYEAHDCERSALHKTLQRLGFCIFGLGHTLRGLEVRPGTAAPRVDRTWESPSYLATLAPERILPRFRAPGWQVLKAGRRSA